MRKTRTIPAVMLSALACEEAKVEGFEKGADDYLIKPFSARELQARVASQIELAERRHELLRRTEATVQNLSGRLISAHDEERNRISRELHDDVAHRLALLSVTLEQYALESHSMAVTEHMGKLSAVQNEVGEIARSVHELAHGLHSSTLRLGLRTALKGLCRTFPEQRHIKVKFEGDEIPLSDQFALSFFRVAQEALSNAIRHSQAKEVFGGLHLEKGLVRMDIRDTGKGFDLGGPI
jgi:signal transduction histidine kinase